MAPRLSASVVARIEDTLREPGAELDRSYLQMIAVTFKTILATVYYYKRRVELNCPVLKPSGGPRRVLGWEIEQAVKLLLNEMLWLYQDEIRDFLFDAYDIEVRRQLIGHFL